MSETLKQSENTWDPMYPHNGSFVLSQKQPIYPAFNENVYLLMRGFNAIKIKGASVNARVNIICNMLRDYSTELWTDYENYVDDVLIFPFTENNGTITFKGEPLDHQESDWKATLTFQFVNLTSDEIERLSSSESS